MCGQLFLGGCEEVGISGMGEEWEGEVLTIWRWDSHS